MVLVAIEVPASARGRGTRFRFWVLGFRIRVGGHVRIGHRTLHYFARNPPAAVETDIPASPRGPGANASSFIFDTRAQNGYLWSCISCLRWPSRPRHPQCNGLVGFASCLFLPPCIPSPLLPVPLLGSLARHHLVPLHLHTMASFVTAPSRDLHASLEERRNLGWLGLSWEEATLENIYHVEVYWRRLVTGLLYWLLSVPSVRHLHKRSPFSSTTSNRNSVQRGQ